MNQMIENVFPVKPSNGTESDVKSQQFDRAPLANMTNRQYRSLSLHDAVPKKAKHSPCRQNRQISGIDANDASYTEEALRYLLNFQKEMKIDRDYMRNQPDLKHFMRAVLIDWMIQACGKFKLADDTLYYAVHYIDRYLSFKKINRMSLQLVGISALHLASKFEEVTVPRMVDLCYITEDSYTPEDLVKTEKQMLKEFDYDLGYPTSVQFVRYLVKLLSCTRSQYYTGKFLCELSTLSYKFIQYLPSTIAISSLDILNLQYSTLLPVLKRLNIEVDETAVAECKVQLRRAVLTDELSDYETVFKKHQTVYKKLVSDLQ